MDKPKKHTKHNKIPRREIGNYGYSEIALLGVKCSDIQKLTKAIISELSLDCSIAYMDADHSSFDNPEKGDYLEQGGSLFLSDKNETIALNSRKTNNRFDNQILFNQADLVLVNGNHFEASHQILFLDSSKVKSIEKRAHQLTNVLAIIEVDTTEVPQAVLDVIPDVNLKPRFKFTNQFAIIQFINEWLTERRPKLKALILAGGKSTRMGQNKANMVYQNQNQLNRISALLKTKVEQVFVSCRKDQDLQTEYPKIYDRAEDMGPLGAITTTFRAHPNDAWLVVACDLPLLDSEALNELIENRSTKHLATAFLNEDTGFAEPLITIWEPKSYMRMLQFESLGYTCPRKVLINSNTKLIKPTDSTKLMNVNTPEDFELATELLK